jgi:hypothetical protein
VATLVGRLNSSRVALMVTDPTRRITDPDVLALASIAATLQPDYVPAADDPWLGSPFEWILKTPSRTRGAIGEKLVAGWCAAKGADVVRSPDSEADRVINGHRVEVKFSTRWRSGGYKFQQVRNQNYAYLIALGVSPFDAHCWVLPKSVLTEYVIGHMGQHTGAAGQDTAWLGFDSHRPYDWMKPYGGRLSDAWSVIEGLRHG